MHAESLGDPPAELELRPLEWDAAFFGVKMGTILPPAQRGNTNVQRANVLEQELRSLLFRAKAETYAHLIFRVPGEDLAAAWAAERAGFKLVDVGVDSTFALGAAPRPALQSDLSVRPAQERDLLTLQELAGQSFVASRFAVDPFFLPEQVVSFYRQWVGNLWRGLAQAVLVVEHEGEVLGFISCALDSTQGRIPLIATEAKARRRGVGRALVSSALEWFAAAGAQVVHVKTQATNYPALALYHRTGFTVSRIELTFSIAF